jgi:deoxyadenosine/deoxycytidine kinase
MNASIGSRVTEQCKTVKSGTPIRMSSDAEPNQSVSVLWVDVEGVIGVGKSTLMGVLMPRLRKEFGENRVFEVPENVGELMRSNLFQKYCRKPKKYAYEFQTMFFHARTEDFLAQWARIEEDVAESTSPFDYISDDGVEKRVIILSERSILSDSIFMRVQFEQGHVKQRQLDNYAKLNGMWRSLYPVAPGLVIYCRAEIPLCQKRIVERHRDGEEALVTESYNTAVLEQHEKVFGNGATVARFHMGRDLDWFFVPVVAFDTTENYRDDELVRLKKSTEILSHIKDNLSRT